VIDVERLESDFICCVKAGEMEVMLPWVYKSWVGDD